MIFGRFLRIGLAVALVGVGLYAFYVWEYHQGSHSDAFSFAEREIRNSASLRSRIGAIERVRLSPYILYREKFWSGIGIIDSGKQVWMRLDVTGTRQEITLKVEVMERNGVWSVEQVLSQGRPIALN